MVTERGAVVALSHASDTFQDTDSGGIEAGDGVALHEEDLDITGDEGDGEQIDWPVLRESAEDSDNLLEGLLSTPKEEKPTGKGDDFSLDDLLTESLETIKESAAVKANRKKLKDTRLSKAERTAIEDKIRQWELAREWTPKASVAMFLQQTCKCGSIHSTFSGMFQRQTHRVSAIERWVPVTDIADSGLPREHKAHTQHVLLCADCAESEGYGDCQALNHVHISRIINPLKAH